MAQQAFIHGDTTEQKPPKPPDKTAYPHEAKRRNCAQPHKWQKRHDPRLQEKGGVKPKGGGIPVGLAGFKIGRRGLPGNKGAGGILVGHRSNMPKPGLVYPGQKAAGPRKAIGLSGGILHPGVRGQKIGIKFQYPGQRVGKPIKGPAAVENERCFKGRKM